MTSPNKIKFSFPSIHTILDFVNQIPIKSTSSFQFILWGLSCFRVLPVSMWSQFLHLYARILLTDQSIGCLCKPPVLLHYTFLPSALFTLAHQLPTVTLLSGLNNARTVVNTLSLPTVAPSCLSSLWRTTITFIIYICCLPFLFFGLEYPGQAFVLPQPPLLLQHSKEHVLLLLEVMDFCSWWQSNSGLSPLLCSLLKSCLPPRSSCPCLCGRVSHRHLKSQISFL